MEIETSLRDSRMENNALQSHLWGAELRTSQEIPLYPGSEVLAAFPSAEFQNCYESVAAMCLPLLLAFSGSVISGRPVCFLPSYVGGMGGRFSL